jgi:hypothetical protein
MRIVIRGLVFAAAVAVSSATDAVDSATSVRFLGRVVDADTGEALPCRLYLRGQDGTWYFPKSADPKGNVVVYQRERKDVSGCAEMHVCLSAHPFTIDLKPGKYTMVIERGKAYLPFKGEVTIGNQPLERTFQLQRWIDLEKLGWYSGDTHVHRELADLPTLLPAEDLNVAFPLTCWVRKAHESPKANASEAVRKLDPRPVFVDKTHVYYPLNTEYELFHVDEKPHTLGAFFVLNHRSILDLATPPVRPVAEQARKEGALLELDKHNWPWSMMIVPIMNVDLFELANNHVWRTEFAFTNWGEREAEFMKVERNDKGWTERGWLEFGFRTYYTLLNCGYRLRPTAGTASGVHPVPLGFGRVYVHLPVRFDYDTWIAGLDRGESFVTTGPLLFAQLDGKGPGKPRPAKSGDKVRLHGTVSGPMPLERIEVVSDGAVVRTLTPQNVKRAKGGFDSTFDECFSIDQTTWIAVRCFEKRPDGRVRFAHSAPFHLDVEGKPLLPRRAEVEYLIGRVEAELKRNADVLPPAALDEYRAALKIYQAKATEARD